MENSQKKLIKFLIGLSIAGFIVATAFSPVNVLVLVLAGITSLIGNIFLVLAIGVFLIIILVNSVISEIITALTSYTAFSNIDSDKISARTKNFLIIYLYNSIFGLILCLSTIFLIYTIFPFENPKIGAVYSDLDFALITSLIVVPGFLLSLRLLANPVEKKPSIPLPMVVSLTTMDREKVKERKNRTESFYFAFIETTVISAIILFIYEVLKSGDGTYKIYFTAIQKMTPHVSQSIISVFLVAFLFSLFITTFVGEFLLERYNPIIQE
jgi:hypothetical protein